MSEVNVIINYVEFKNEDRERDQKNAIDILYVNISKNNSIGLLRKYMDRLIVIDI